MEPMHGPELGRLVSGVGRAPRMQQLPFQIVLRDVSSDDPQVLILRDVDLRGGDVRPLLEKLPVQVKHLYAVVVTIPDVDASGRVDGNGMRLVELAWSLAQPAP